MIHPTAIIDDKACLAPNVSVGAFTTIGAEVEIAAGCVVGSNVVIKGPTKIGSNCQIFQFASIGEDCQDKKYHGERTYLAMGSNNIIREGVTIHRGTVQDKSITRIGDDNLFMAYAHVAHDCVIGSHCIMANQATLGGHVSLGDFAIIGGLTAVHQFCHIGQHAMIGGMAAITMDVVAYTIVNGNPAHTRGINTEGLHRRGFSNDEINALRQAYRYVFRHNLNLEEAIQLIQQQFSLEIINLFVESIQHSQRGITR